MQRALTLPPPYLRSSVDALSVRCDGLDRLARTHFDEGRQQFSRVEDALQLLLRHAGINEPTGQGTDVHLPPT